jgi:hypothetical protein
MPDEPQTIRLDDLQPDEQNANRGTDRGAWALQESLIRFGVGRGVLADREGRLIAGNKTAAALRKLNPDIPVIVVPTTGDSLVVTQRLDLDLEEDSTARELAIADNRVAELDLAWDAQQIAAGLEEGLDLGIFFHQHEIDSLLHGDEEEGGKGGKGKTKGDEHDPVPEMAIQPFEHYDYVLILFRNTWDWAQAVDRLGLQPEGFSFTDSQGKPHRKIGLCRVLDGARFLERLQACESSSPAAGASPPAATS